MSRVDLSMNTDISSYLERLFITKTRRILTGELHDLVRRLAHRVGCREVHATLSQEPLALVDVRAFHSNDDRHRDAKLLDGSDDALREHIAPQNAAKDVDEHGLHVLVRHQDLERVPNLFR